MQCGVHPKAYDLYWLKTLSAPVTTKGRYSGRNQRSMTGNKSQAQVSLAWFFKKVAQVCEVGTGVSATTGRMTRWHDCARDATTQLELDAPRNEASGGDCSSPPL